MLSLLQPGPRYGYQLKTEFESMTGGVWKLNVGQVYTTLDRLERDGFVTVELIDDDQQKAQKQYHLTAAGHAELGAWWQAVPADEPPPRDELMLKVLMAIGAGHERAIEVITRQRSALFALLQRHRRQPAAATDDPVAFADRLVVDALIVRAEADLRWLDLCEHRLAAQYGQPSRKDSL